MFNFLLKPCKTTSGLGCRSLVSPYTFESHDCSVVHVGQTRFKHWSEESKLKAVKVEHFIIYAMLCANQLVAPSRRHAHKLAWLVWQSPKALLLESILECIHRKTSKHTSSHSQIHGCVLLRGRAIEFTH